MVVVTRKDQHRPRQQAGQLLEAAQSGVSLRNGCTLQLQRVALILPPLADENVPGMLGQRALAFATINLPRAAIDPHGAVVVQAASSFFPAHRLYYLFAFSRSLAAASSKPQRRNTASRSAWWARR